MIDAATLQKTLPARLRALPEGHALDVRTYKRDRGAVFVRNGQDAWRVLEHGYRSRDTVVSGAGLARTVKDLVRSEFPRSNKIRVYALGPFDPERDALLPFKRI